jgi:hypothetical protein
MVDYLYWLNNKYRAQNRYVFLFINNFSGYELGITLISRKTALLYIRIKWLPANTTSY